MKNFRNIFITTVLAIIAAGFTYIVKIYDVAYIGPNETKVGFSKLNNWFRNLVGTNLKLYDVAKYAGYAVLLIVGIYGLIGLVQLIKRKSLFKIDREIIALGILYVLDIIIYMAFEKVIVNYRPILIDGKLEASYPSSHTILAFTVCLSSMVVCAKYIKSKKLTNLAYFVTMLLLTLVALGRTLSGAHWLTDIIGGILISFTLLMIFYSIIHYNKPKKKKRK